MLVHAHRQQLPQHDRALRWLRHPDAVRAGDARGNLAFDAQIVAVCREQGAVKLLTMDRDFARFPGIQTLDLDSEPEAET